MSDKMYEKKRKCSFVSFPRGFLISFYGEWRMLRWRWQGLFLNWVNVAFTNIGDGDINLLAATNLV